MKFSAPGKLILSGEHSVVHGKPALAMAVDKYVTATISREQLPQVSFDLSDLAHRSHLSFHALQHLKNKIKRKYHKFICGDYSIREVLQKPFELAQFALGVFTEALNLSLPHGIKIHVESTIPMGCGMGSSAATILSVMNATSHYLQVPLSQEDLFRIALEAENMQHGYSSGLDLRIAMQGGCIYKHGQIVEVREIPRFPLYLINTGTPLTTTGECIENVAKHFKTSQIGDDFTHVTNKMDNALQKQSFQQMYESIRENQQLLNYIGVVPTLVQTFVRQIEQAGGAAKICGAGAVRGQHAGAVLVMIEDELEVSSISELFGYSIVPISGESRGVHAA